MDTWTDKARLELIASRGTADAWGYRVDSAPSSEPTALAGLALAQSRPAEARKAADWLASIQQANGSVGLTATVGQPAWPTSLAVLLWSFLASHGEPRQRAVAWLLSARGTKHDHEKGILGHDPSILGWPWLESTHSWIEPTALAVIALRRDGQSKHQRVSDGLRLLRDRALAHGGWNVGVTSTFGVETRPQPTSTGQSLVALAGIQPADRIIEQACAYLERTLPRVRAPMSLAWGLMGLTAWQRRPKDAAQWLSEAHAAALRQRDCLSLHLALLLLADRETPLELERKAP